MTERRKSPRPLSPKESVEEGLEEQLERTDEKHAKKPARKTRGIGELQRDPKRAMREPPKAGGRKKD